MKIGIIGRGGFIGSALSERFRSHETYSYPRPDLDILYHFGSPSSDIIYKQNLEWAMRETIESFLNAISFCRKHKIKLVYPSSANVYQLTTVYSHGKAALEQIHEAFGGDVLGLRIFCGYGPTEGHKGEYASIVYQFVQQMKRGLRPVLFGDGSQTRDFVYIDDIVDEIIEHSDSNGIIDIGTGVNTSFNEIVRLINQELGTAIEPIYVDKPMLYVNDTPCSKPFTYKVDIQKGISILCKK